MGHIAIILLWLLFWCIPALAFFYAIYFLTTLPLRRQERARFFIDLLEGEVRKGSNVEQAIVHIAQSQDRALGIRFHLLAVYLESGLRLTQALDKVPRFLPPQLAEVLKAGEQIGDLKKVLPVCRSLLHDAQSRTQSAFNYLIIIAFVLTPVVPYIYLTIQAVVMPKYLEIFSGYLGDGVPKLTLFVHEFGSWLALAQLALAGAIYVGAFIYIGGPRVWNWLRHAFGPILDQAVLLIPWRRKRIERNFSAVLALLLDANLPEARAVQLAARTTANEIFVLRAERAASQFASGMTLQEVLPGFDETGELRWRIANASHSKMNFQHALTAWHEALEAKAYQQEQAASQVITTGLVFLNGLLVAVLIIGLFQALVELLNTAVLW